MAYDIGPRIGIDGEAEFRKSIQQVSQTVKTLGSEMKVIASSFAGNEKSIESFAAKNEVLAKAIGEQEKKLELLREGLSKSAELYGQADTKTQKWQQVVNETTAELNRMKKELSDNERAMDELGEETEETGAALDEAGQSALSFGDILKANIVSDLIVDGAKKIADGIREIAGELKEFVQSSIESFSDYEQLTGGVETLFKSSSDQVMAYAQNAFKTAGLSANEYMETVTSFSASLLQGLGGDTAKAAEIADLAITDMADNANKMGTAMGSIQDAYQGFAKQNYTMLDNLKLGYGGTQAEMLRLINDSGILNEEISSLDQVSFDQIIQAIHAVQTQIGITGTTALEAEETIQGSTAAMKSAWENLKTGLASGDQDLGKLVEDFTTSVETSAKNLLPRIKTVLGNIGPMIGEFIQQDLVAELPKMAESGVEMLDAFVSGITENLPNLSEVITTLTGNLSQYIRENMPEFVASGMDLISELASSLRENAGLMVDAGIELVTSLAQGLADSFPTIIEKLPGIVSDIAGVINDNAPKILEAGVNIIVTLGKGLIEAIPTLIANLPAIIKSIVDVFSAYNWLNLGKTIINGLGNGIKSMASFAKTSAGNIKDVILNKIKELPSALLNVGKDMIKKLWEGITSMGTWLKNKLGGFISSAISAVTGESSKSSSSTSSKAKAVRAVPAAAEEAGEITAVRALRAAPAAQTAANIQSSIAGVGESLRSSGVLRRVQRDIDNTIAGVSSYYSAAREARTAGNALNGQSGGVTAAELAAAVREALNGASVTLDGRTVGRLVTVQQTNMGRAFGTA